MLKKFLSAALLFFAFQRLYSQDESNLTKQFKCFNQSAFSTLDFLISDRETGEYEPMAEWSERVSSSDIVRKKFPLEEDYQYVILLATEPGVDASALEIRNSAGEKLEYEYKVNDLDRNQITFFFTAPDDDIYQISFRTVTSKQPAVCMYMAILKGEIDPESGGQE